MSKLSKGQEAFIDKLLTSFEKGKIPWRSTWDRPILLSYNEITKKGYKGLNQLNLYMTAMSKGWDEPRWMTFKQANDAGYKVKKGSIGTDIFHFAIQNRETKKIIDVKEYNALEDDERKNYKIISKSYRVFNGTQIDGLEKLDIKDCKVEYENDKATLFSSTFLSNANLTLKHGGDSAYYRPSEDFIQLPSKEQFMSERAYYATLLHECSHATSHATRLNREISTSFGSDIYATEELRAELASAFLTLDMGFGSSTFHEDNHIAYVQEWITSIKKDPTVIFKAINDAQKIREYILKTGEFVKIYENDNELQKETEEKVSQKVNIEESNSMSIPTLEDRIISEEKQTIVINLFAGPGAGKTTCAWEIASKLKKMNYVTEYVPKYAKELVWDDRRDLLDGSLEHQQLLLEEQSRRVNRLLGKVDFIVTDAPELINLNFLFLKCDDNELAQQYHKDVVSQFNDHHNFNLFIQRGDRYETAGRIHTRQESKELDKTIKNILDDNKIFYEIYEHKSIDQVISNCIVTYDKAQEFQVLEETEPVTIKNKMDLNQLKNSISIVEYARDVLNFSLVKESRGLFRVEEHDSCKIYPNNTFYRYSNNVGGSIIDFIKHFEQCDTQESIEKMQEYYESYHPDIRFDSSKSIKPILNTKGISDIVMPEKAETNKHVYAYLTKTRCVKTSVVNEYINSKLLYEDVNKNCVFVGKYDNSINYANIISSNGRSKFKQDVTGSIKEIGIYINNNASTLVINEAVIDQMSYMSLANDPKEYNYLSVQGCANTVSALRFHFKKREEASEISKVVFALDNDAAGEKNTFKAIDYLKENYPNVETQVHIPDGNDFNDHLKKEMNILASAAPNSEQSVEMK